MQSKDEEDLSLSDEESFSGMSDYDNGRAAPDDDEGDDYQGCGNSYCDFCGDADELDEDDD